MDRYRKMFDQAVKQLGPERDRVDALRTELARRCPDGQEKEVVAMKKRTKLLRSALIAAAVIALLTATGAAVALGQREQIAMVTGDREGGVYRLDGRYYFKLDTDSEPIDITGQFSDTVPYVYDPELPPDEVGNLYTYVVGGSGDDIGCITAIKSEGEDVFSGFQLVWTENQRMAGCPIWWRTYCYSQEALDTSGVMRYCRDGFNEDSWHDVLFDWALDSLDADAGTGAVTLTVKGEVRDITAELDGGRLYVLAVDGDERVLVEDDPSLLPDHEPPYYWQDPEEWEKLLAYEDSCVYAPCTHEVLVCRDGDEVRYAEFVYRPDGTLRYWMPWNCPSSAELGWLEEYAAQHGFGMDWLMDNAFEQPAQEFTQAYMK